MRIGALGSSLVTNPVCEVCLEGGFSLASPVQLRPSSKPINFSCARLPSVAPRLRPEG